MNGKIEINGVTYIPVEGNGYECSKCAIPMDCYNICRFFGQNLHFARHREKPTMADYQSITSYEDACEALCERPVLNAEPLNVWDGKGRLVERLPDHIVALMKLETISRAMWGFDYKPKPIMQCNRNLCQESTEKLNYFYGETFEELWKRYSELTD